MSGLSTSTWVSLFYPRTRTGPAPQGQDRNQGLPSPARDLVHLVSTHEQSMTLRRDWHIGNDFLVQLAVLTLNWAFLWVINALYVSERKTISTLACLRIRCAVWHCGRTNQPAGTYVLSKRSTTTSLAVSKQASQRHLRSPHRIHLMRPFCTFCQYLS